MFMIPTQYKIKIKFIIGILENLKKKRIKLTFIDFLLFHDEALQQYLTLA